MAGVVALSATYTVKAMHKVSDMPGLNNDSLTAGSVLNKTRGGASLSPEQLTNLKRRIMTARTGLSKIHVVGKKSRVVPPNALDALAIYRENGVPDVEIHWDSDWGIPFFVKGHDLTLQPGVQLAKRGYDMQVAAALGTFSRLPRFLGLQESENELRLISQQVDHLGMTHVRFQQTYHGHDVWAREIYVHFTKEGRINLINGRWIPTPIKLDKMTPTVSADDAIEAMKAHYPGKPDIQVGQPELVIYVDHHQVPHWAWVAQTALSSFEGYNVFIDAVNGEFFHSISYIYYDGPVIGTGVDLFDVQRTVYAYQIGSNYCLINTTKSMYDPISSVMPSDVRGGIVIYNGINWPNYASFICSYYLDNWANPAAISGSFHFGYIYDYFWDVHERTSFDNNGATINAVVNDLSINGRNNACYNPALNAFFFGVGDGITFWNLSGGLDIAAHEFGHGVVDATTGLVYEFESGALNESFADIFGTLVEYYVYGEYGNWLIGEDVYIPGASLRNMADPTLGGSPQPSTYSDLVLLPATDDHGGVHTNCGIPNKAFYLIATAIGLGKADSIYYHVLTTGKLTPYSQFSDLRLGVIEAAEELYPGAETVISAINSAFDAVEISAGTGSVEPEPEPVPTSDQWIVAKDELSGRLAQFDTTGAFIKYLSTRAIVTRPTVPDSADVIFFIDDSYNVSMINSDGTGEVQIGNPEIAFANIAVSPDGTKLAFDIQWKDTLFIIDLTDPSGAGDKILPLYTPTYDGTAPMHNVLYPDIIEWDIYSRSIICDCLNWLPRQIDTILYWDILHIDPESQIIKRPLPSISTGVTVGNPTFAKTLHNIIAFDAELVPGIMSIMGGDLARNITSAITTNFSSWGCPSFSPDDSKIVYHFLGDLWRVDLDSTHIQKGGSDYRFALWANYPNWRFEGRDKIPTKCDCGVQFGDINLNGSVDPVDVVYLVNYVYKNWDARVPLPNCPYENGDVNCDGNTYPTDVVYLVGYVYKNWKILCDPCE